MAEPTLYLFDGFNLLHAGGFASPDELQILKLSLSLLRRIRWCGASAHGPPRLIMGDSGAGTSPPSPKSHPEVEGEDSKLFKFLQVQLQWTQYDTNTCSCPPPPG